MSKLQKSWGKFRWTGPEYDIAILPVSGSTDVALVVTRLDRPVNRAQYGQVLESYAKRKNAEKARAALLDMRARQFAAAYP